MKMAERAARARLKDVQVAGKTGTAQATDRGHKDTIAWFACFAPFDNPKYVVAVMVQGGEHGGSVAGPVATRILSERLAMDEGKFDMQVAWLSPAHKANPFQMIKDVNYAGGNVPSGDEENADDSQSADAQMASADAAPDVEPEADSQGKVRRRASASVARAVPVATPQPRNFFERLFGATTSTGARANARRRTPTSWYTMNIVDLTNNATISGVRACDRTNHFSFMIDKVKKF